MSGTEATDTTEQVSPELMGKLRVINQRTADERGVTLDDFLADPLSSGSTEVSNGLWSFLKRLFVRG